MDKKEIYQMVLQEMTEHALVQRRERFNEEEQNNYQELLELSRKKQEIMAKLSPEDRQVLDDYITKTHLAAQDECEYLYALSKSMVPLIRLTSSTHLACNFFNATSSIS